MNTHNTNYFTDGLGREEQNKHEQRRDAHDFSGGRGGEIPLRRRANFACPQCDPELVPGPWDSWVCWRCDDVIYVERGERR